MNLVNLEHKDPFNVVLCKTQPNSQLSEQFLSSQTLNGLSVGPPILTSTSQCYSELFPKSDLVYLSPNAPDVLEEFSPNDIYIIGAIWDKKDPQPLSYHQAKKDQIRCARLPVDFYLQ